MVFQLPCVKLSKRLLISVDKIKTNWRLYGNNFGAAPTRNSDFSALRKAAKFVDKTRLIYTLASKRQKFFLSRPRRFGKSLLLSTFESLFKYGLRDFHGLEIESLWKDENTYQVIRLDFSNLKDFSSVEEFSELLDQYLDTLTVNRLVSPIKTDKERSSCIYRLVSPSGDNP